MGGIDDLDALVLPGRLVYPGNQHFGIGIADFQQRINLPPKQFHGDDILQQPAIVHVLCAEPGEAKTAICQIVLVLGPEVSLSPDVITADAVEREGLAQRVNVLSDSRCQE